MPRTRIERLWLGGGTAVAVLVVVVGYFFLISPQRSSTTSVQGQVADTQLQASTLQSRIATLTSQQKKLSTYQAALHAAQSSLPSAGDASATPALLRSLQDIASTTSTSVSSLTVGDPSAMASAAPVATASASTTAPATPTTPTASTAPTSNLYSVAITASVTGSAPHLVGFMTALQHRQPRAVLISGMGLTGTRSTAKGAAPFTLTLTMTAFERPSDVVPPTGGATPSASVTTP